MPNINQPTLRAGSTGPAVRRLQRALRRTPDLSLVVDGVLGSRTDAAVRLFQGTQGLAVDGIVGPATWSALPDGGAMPELRTGSTGNVVASLQRVLTNGASNGWPAPGPSDGDFGPQTEASVRGFQSWGGVMVSIQGWCRPAGVERHAGAWGA
jgi:peptidoglycan hydrolase-like protein with peptidoglycan-binding domain